MKSVRFPMRSFRAALGAALAAGLLTLGLQPAAFAEWTGALKSAW